MRRIDNILGQVCGNTPEETEVLAGSLRVKPTTQSLPPGACRCTFNKWNLKCDCERCITHYASEENNYVIETVRYDPYLGQRRRRGTVLPTTQPSSYGIGMYCGSPRGDGKVGLQCSSGDKIGSNKEDPFGAGVETCKIGDFEYLKNGNVIGQMNPGKHWRVGGLMTFARLPQLSDVKHADAAIVGVPFDNGCSFRTGARFGPEQIRVHSKLIRPYQFKTGRKPLYEQQVADAGDLDVTPYNIPKAMQAIYEGLKAIISSRAEGFVIIGGDHTISYPAIRALYEKFGPIALIHFDAHLDTFPEQFGQDIWHGSPFRMCWKEGLFAKDASTHVGIRATTWSGKDAEESTEMGIKTIYTEDVHERGIDPCVEEVIRRAGNHPTYVSIDIDVLDPAIAPGTGTPEFGGLLSHQMLDFVRKLDKLNVVSGDVVEVLPAHDMNGITSLAASSLVQEILTLMLKSKERK